MSSRAEILDKVRAALADAPQASPVSRAYRQAAPAGDLAAKLVERIEDYQATVRRCAAPDLESQVADALAGQSVIVPPDLGFAVPGATTDATHTAAELDAIQAVVTTSTLAIAETGTIVLDHGPGQGRRMLSLVPDLHVCVVFESTVVAGVVDAIALLDPARPQTWISGPSATSDIELNRVEGVHGPRTLHVILVADPA